MVDKEEVVITIRLGNAAMLTNEDVGDALRDLGTKLIVVGWDIPQTIKDTSGNKVGTIIIT